jgi:hypothetical protein
MSRPARSGCGQATGATITRFTKLTEKVVSNTILPVDLLENQWTIPGGTLNTDQHISFWASGDWLQQTGANRPGPSFHLDWSTAVPVGGASIFDSILDAGGAAVVGDDARRFGWFIYAEIQALGSATSQWASVFAGSASSGSRTITGGGVGTLNWQGATALDPLGVGGTGYAHFHSWGTCNYGLAINTAVDWQLHLKVLNQFASVNYSTRFKAAQMLIYSG